MSMKKKLAGLMAISMMAFGVMAGCGGNAGNNTGNNTGDNTGDNNAQGEGGTLRMGTNATFPPYEMVDENNNVIGIDAEIAADSGTECGSARLRYGRYDSRSGTCRAG